MIALALLFIVIIGLLSVIVWLLQKYFEMYIALSNGNSDELQRQFELQEKNTSCIEINTEIYRQINERLTEMEAKFPTEETQEELVERLIRNFKKVIDSTLKLLKTN